MNYVASQWMLQPELRVASTDNNAERSKEWGFILEPRMLTPNEIERIIVRLENYQQALSSESNPYHSLYSRVLQIFIDAIRRHVRHGVLLKTTLRRPLLLLCSVSLENTLTPSLSKVNKKKAKKRQLVSSVIEQAIRQIEVGIWDGSIHEHVPLVIEQLYPFWYVALSKSRTTKILP
jgi:hypothetical protein